MVFTSKSKYGGTRMSTSNELVVLVNDNLNLLRGKLVRFILEDGDLRMIANLVEIIDQFGLEYDQEGMVYRMPKQEKKGHTNIPRAQLARELEPGLNALFGAEYAQHDPNLSPEEKAALKKKAAKQRRESKKAEEAREAKRLETNRKAREKYHAKKKGKANGSKARKTSS
jgi:hypothetical protein